ncbi:MAG: transposase [Hassallia sp. WJT32-NPBG1]|nr:transposase [Hassallia sp. WJT32-NPBG1]
MSIIYTPKHASWLNQVEIELSVLSRQCLEAQIGDRSTLEARNCRLGETAQFFTSKCKLAL